MGRKMDVSWDAGEPPKNNGRGRSSGGGEWEDLRRVIDQSIEKYVGPDRKLPSPWTKIAFAGIAGDVIESKIKSAAKDAYKYCEREYQCKDSGWNISIAKRHNQSALWFRFISFKR